VFLNLNCIDSVLNKIIIVTRLHSRHSLLCACWIPQYPPVSPPSSSEFSRILEAGSGKPSRPHAFTTGHWLHQEALSKIIKAHCKISVPFPSFWDEFLCGVRVLRLLERGGSSTSPRSSPDCLSGRFCGVVLGCHPPLLLAPALAF